MPFDTNLIALSWQLGQYEVVAQINTHCPLVDTAAIENDGLFNDVSENAGYVDKAAILQMNDFAKYLLPESNTWHKPAVEWYASLPKGTMFIIVHKAEWESFDSDF